MKHKCHFKSVLEKETVLFSMPTFSKEILTSFYIFKNSGLHECSILASHKRKKHKYLLLIVQ